MITLTTKETYDILHLLIELKNRCEPDRKNMIVGVLDNLQKKAIIDLREKNEKIK